MLDPETFEFRWTPTAKDGARAADAVRRANRAVWVDRAVGAMFVLGGLAELGHSQPLAVFFLVWGLLTLTGLSLRARRFFSSRRNPHLYGQEVVETLGGDGVTSQSPSTSQTFTWTHFEYLIVLDDMLVLATLEKGRAFLLPKRGLADQAAWGDVVNLAASRVRVHPRSPLRPDPETAVRWRARLRRPPFDSSGNCSYQRCPDGM